MCENGGFLLSGSHITYAMATRDLPDIYALALRPQAMV